MRTRVFVLAAAAVVALAGAASAQSGRWREPSPSIAGAWRFETSVYDTDCRMRGEMTIRRSTTEGIYDCRFVAFERCPDTEDAVIQTEAQQICQATRDGDSLSIVSEIVRVKESTAYWPDNFELTIRSGLLMEGELVSADIAPVTFQRDPGPTS